MSGATSARALGVDVGLRKGLDLVLLSAGRTVKAVERRLPHERFRDVVLEWRPDVVAIDSPPGWASESGARKTELALFRLGLNLYLTPSEGRRSANGFHDWMVAGMDAFRAIEDCYPLFTGGDPAGHALEVFPHAAAAAFAGGLMPAGARKAAWRRSILMGMGVADSRLRGPDLVDAALAALTGLCALEGNAWWSGDPTEGVIVLPCAEAAEPPRFRRLPPVRPPGE